MTLPSHTCKFCQIASGAPSADVDAIWLENDRYLALVSIGALVPGWSLLVPKRHSTNLAEEYEQDSFHEFACQAVRRVQSVFGGRVAVFEHGCTDEQSLTGCGVGHAHLHVVPLSFSLCDASVEFDGMLSWKKCQLSDVKQTAGGREYLFVSDNYEEHGTAGNLLILEQGVSQFFRRVIAKELGRDDEFNYRLFEQRETVLRSLDALSVQKLLAA